MQCYTVQYWNWWWILFYVHVFSFSSDSGVEREWPFTWIVWEYVCLVESTFVCQWCNDWKYEEMVCLKLFGRAFPFYLANFPFLRSHSLLMDWKYSWAITSNNCANIIKWCCMQKASVQLMHYQTNKIYLFSRKTVHVIFETFIRFSNAHRTLYTGLSWSQL